MELFRRLFAEKILKFHEGTNKNIRVLMKIPYFKKLLENEIFDKDKSWIRTTLGVIAQFFVVLFEFMKKYLYVVAFMYLPCHLLIKYLPIPDNNQELIIIYMFFVLSTLCGSICNNTLQSVGDRDYLIVKVLLVSPYMNFLGKLIYKMITDFVYFTVILCLFKVPVYYSVMVGVLTLCARPVGEMLAIVAYDNIKGLSKRRGLYHGFIMAAGIMFAYALPLLNEHVLYSWLIVTNPLFVLFTFICGVAAMYYLWDYKYYRRIVMNAIPLKKEC